MKALKIFLTAMLLMAASIPLAAFESIEIVTPHNGKNVNANGFTLVAKAQGEFYLDQYRVHFILNNMTNFDLQDAYVSPTGTHISGGPYDLEIISPKPSDLDGTTCKSVNSKLSFIVHVGNLFEGYAYHLTVQIQNLTTNEYVNDWVVVHTE